MLKSWFPSWQVTGILKTFFSKIIPPSPSGRPRLSQNACFQIYLREFKEEGRGLPKTFLASLKRSLAHYGIQDLADSVHLRQALLRIHLAHQNRSLRKRIAFSLSQRLLKLSWAGRGASYGFENINGYQRRRKHLRCSERRLRIFHTATDFRGIKDCSGESS